MKESELIKILMTRKNLKDLLLYLGNNQGSSYDIAKHLGIGYGEVYRNMKILEKWGLIEGREERVEGKLMLKKVYRLTKKGEKILNLLRDKIIKRTVAYFDSVGLSEDLWRELEKLRHSKGSNKKIQK